MSKLFWGILTLFSLLITAWSGFFVYNELQTKESTSVPLLPLPAAQEQTPAVETSSATVVIPEVLSSTASTAVLPQPVEPSKPKRINGKELVEFSYTKGTPKKVYLVGEFNKWFRQPMKRDGDTWSFSVPLAPGKYQYVFVIDEGTGGATGKRVLDPNNDQKTKDGKLSILTVKPFSVNR